MKIEVTLQLDYLKLHKTRKHWNLYFVFATSDPNNPGKMMLTTLPAGADAPTIKMTHAAHNEIHFQPKGASDGDGMFIFKRDMPDDCSVQARLWMMQSRKSLKAVSTILKDISSFLGAADNIVTKAGGLGIPQPWLVAEKAANKGIGGVSTALANLDGGRNLGFVNLDEHFGAEYDKDAERDFSNTLSTGFAEIGWTWSVIKENPTS